MKTSDRYKRRTSMFLAMLLVAVMTMMALQTQASAAPTGITFDKSSMLLVPGNSEALTAAISPATESQTVISWTSNNPAVAEVSSPGPTGPSVVITAKSQGSAIITGYATATLSATCTVIVTESLDANGVSLNKTSLNLQIGDTELLKESVSPALASNKMVTWTSSDPSIASVDSNGLILAKKDGTVTITVKTVDGGYTATCRVSVGTGGGTAKYAISHTSGLRFQVNANASNLTSVSVDGRKLSSSDYRVYSGASSTTYIELASSAVNSLSSGLHSISARFSDGDAEGTFYVQTVNNVPNVYPPSYRPPTNTKPATKPSSSRPSKPNYGYGRGSSSSTSSNSGKWIVDEGVDEGVEENMIVD